MIKTIKYTAKTEPDKHRYINNAYALACAYCCRAEATNSHITISGTRPNVLAVWRILKTR